MAVDVDRLKKEGLYAANAPLGSVASDLLEVQNLGAGWRQTRKRLQTAAWVAWIVGFIGLAVQPVVGVVLIAASIFAFYHVKSYPKQVAKDERRGPFARSVIGMLAADAAENAPVALRVEFNPKRDLLSEGGLPGYKNGKQKLFKTSWFSLETTLHDGTGFSQTIEDIVRERSYSNARGKQKSKTRTRCIVSMRFGYAPETYGDVAPLGKKLASEIRLPTGCIVRGVEATDKAIKVKALLKDESQLERATSMMALGVYRVLNYARETKSKKGSAK